MTSEEPTLEVSDPPGIPVGLRERKKQETRDRLQRAAFALFAKKGFRQTRISEIAEAAAVSESTFFRYFEGKEGVALESVRRRAQATVEAVCARPAHETPIEACLAVARSAESAGFAPAPHDADEFALLRRTPALAPYAMAMAERFINILAEDVARRLGEPVDSLRVRLQAHALNMANKAAMEVWLADPEGVDLQAANEAALLELQRGL
jgi:AcrR family transcriptional regulator